MHVEHPSSGDSDLQSELNVQYRARPRLEKEAFAHRYADDFRQGKVSAGLLPFDRIFNQGQMQQVGLNAAWFKSDVAA